PSATRCATERSAGRADQESLLESTTSATFSSLFPEEEPSPLEPARSTSALAEARLRPAAFFREALFLRRRFLPPFGKFLSSSRATAEGLRAARIRAPRSTSSPSGVCETEAASSATARRRSWFRAAWTIRRALRPWARPEELTSRPRRRLVSGQRCAAYCSCSSRV